MAEGTYWGDETRRRISRRGALRAGGMAGAGLAGAFLIGCDSDDDAATTPTPTPDQPAAPTPAATPEGPDTGPRSGGTLGMPNGVPQDNFNVVVNVGESLGLSGWHVYDRPLSPRLDDRVFVLEAAESIEVPDETTVVMTLKEGLVYQDRAPVNGRPVRSDDIAVMHEYVAQEERATDPFFQTRILESTETPDDRTIVLHLLRPDAYLFTGSSLGLPHNNAIVPSELTLGDLDTMEPVGSGPYMLDEFQFGVRYEYVRSPTWREASDGLPYIDRRVRLPMTDSAALDAAFRSEQTHVWIPPAEAADRLTTDLGDRIEVEEFVALNPFVWALSSRQDWTQDARVREAFYRAFDAQEHIDLVADGWGVPTPGKLPQSLDPYLLDDSEVAEYARHDPEEARQLLDAAGFDFDHTYTITTPANPVGEQSLQVFAEQWRRIGLDTRTVVAPIPEWLPNISATGNYDLAGGVGLPAFDTPWRHLRLHHSQPFSPNAWWGIRDPEIDVRIEASEQELDRETQIDLVKGVQRELLSNYAHMSYVYTQVQRELRWAYVRDWEFSSTLAVMYRTEAWLDV